MDLAVELLSVSKRFGDRVAVRDLDLRIPSGSLFGFIGPNGSGKTTTIRMILDIVRPDEGSVRVLGRPNEGSANDRTGYLPEERGLYRRMKVRELLRFHARLKGVPKPDAAIDAWLERLDLGDRGQVRVETLSKGLSQKVQFAAAVLHQPELLILDEPFSGLDPVSVDAIREIILELRANGTTVIFSTHDMSSAEQLCDTVMMLHRGDKVLDGSVDEIKTERGVRSLRVAFEDPQVSLDDPDVTRNTNYGRHQVLEIRPGADEQAVLHRLLERGRLREFTVTTPSLHEIFVAIAGSDSDITDEPRGLASA